MKIRRAERKDMSGITKLLEQVLSVHHEGRPDLFKADSRKYTDDELAEIILDDEKPVFVAQDEDGMIKGYAFCILIQLLDNHIMTDIRTLYIDDLCVDESCRGQHLGAALFDYVTRFAQKKGCYNVTLNVWACNEGAKYFYEKCGLKPQKIGMEMILPAEDSGE